MDVAIIINVLKRPHTYSRGPLGYFTVPAMEDGQFGMLVVRSDGEVQDVGGKNRKRNDLIPARKIAEDIIGAEGLKRGLYICAAEPEVPRSYEKAELAEREFLALQQGELRNKVNPVTKIREFRTAYEPDVKEKMIELSHRVRDERIKFDETCRKMVKESEVSKAQENLIAYFQNLVKEGDRLWAREQTKAEVNEHHKEAAIALGYEPPWCYQPGVNIDCPACGTKVKKGVAMCGSCHAILDDAAARKYKVGPYAPQLVQKSA